MRIEYEPTYHDFKAAYTAYRKKTRFSAAIHFIFFKGVPFAMAASLLLAVEQAFRGQLNAAVYGAAPSLLSLTVVVFVSRFFHIRRQVKNFFPATAGNRTVVTEICEESISTSVAGLVRTEYLWEAISVFLSSPQVNLLYIAPERFILIPSRILTAEQKASLREIVARKGIRTRSC